MLSHLFLGMSLVGAEWVLYLLIVLSIVSVALIFERLKFYREATRGLETFRKEIRSSAATGKWDAAAQIAKARSVNNQLLAPDLESEMALALLSHSGASTEVLSELAQDSVLRARIKWERG